MCAKTMMWKNGHFSFFLLNTEMDLTIHTYPKLVLVYMDGIVMGGGVGISIGAQYRIVTERTKWAMPEVNIGFFPDVGASYFLSRMPGFTGRYLALTGSVIDATDALYVHAADQYMKSSEWPAFVQSIRDRTWSIDTVEAQLKEVLQRHTTEAPSQPSLVKRQPKIDKHFSFDTVEEIVDSLNQAAKTGDEWAEKTVTALEAKSPTSLKVALELLIRGQKRSLVGCLKMELNLAMNFMENDDFYEGVRAVLVDKDHRPRWRPADLEGVAVHKTFF